MRQAIIAKFNASAESRAGVKSPLPQCAQRLAGLSS